MDHVGAQQTPGQEYTELILDLVAQIPSSRVSTYGALADAGRVLTGRGSARSVGRILSAHGHQVPWWRVVPATGLVPAHLQQHAGAHLRSEGTPLSGTDPLRVNLTLARWEPQI